MTDGFTGNVVLKSVEGAAEVILDMVREEVARGGLLSQARRGADDRRAASAASRRTDYAEHGGAPLLGVDGVALICHGGSNAMAIKNAVCVADRFAQMRPAQGADRGGRAPRALCGTVRRRRRVAGGRVVIRSRIVGTGRAVPPKVLTNDDLSKMVDTSDSWIVERTGIRERHILDPSLAASDLADRGGAEGLPRGRASIPSTVDCIIVGTVTGDCPFPATATFVQKKLGAQTGGCAFDLSAACAGFLYGMSIADAFIRTGQFKQRAGHRRRGAVAHRRLDGSRTCVLFGDGAGAVLLTADDERRARHPVDAPVRGRLADRDPLAARRRQPRAADAGEPRREAPLREDERREVYKHAVRNMAASARSGPRGERHRRPTTSPG